MKTKSINTIRDVALLIASSTKGTYRYQMTDYKTDYRGPLHYISYKNEMELKLANDFIFKNSVRFKYSIDGVIKSAYRFKRFFIEVDQDNKCIIVRTMSCINNVTRKLV